MTDDLAVVAIGRNEGERLRACLASLSGVRVVYVDSGSRDGSVDLAIAMGAEVVELNPGRPFTAARARREGYDYLCKTGCPEFIQFVDGDCALQDGWLSTASEALRVNPKYGVVTGWRREIHPDASLYNDLCHHEWNRPAGDILTCGGDMMVRRQAIEEAGSFEDQVIAAEDDEFCVRIRKAGWTIHRIPEEMTRHDAAMLRFSQWWQRAVRSGHGFAQVGHMHPPYFGREQKRVWLYGVAIPALMLIGLVTSGLLTLLGLAAYVYNFLRTASGLRKEGMSPSRARRHAVLITLSKIPNAIGMLIYHRRRILGHKMQIIEYK